ncbi:MAG: hypothetical protein U9P14_08175 [Gemmatimonadota bacterium]|nr:hypothetical protein [Gemmatimonadota bacterium]
MDRGLIMIKKYSNKRPRWRLLAGYERDLSWAEYSRVRSGLAPSGPEDKWLIYRRGQTVYFRRSGNGTLVYKVRFAPEGGSFRAVEAHLNVGPGQLDPMPEPLERRMLDYLIDRLLLGHSAGFPVSESVDSEQAAVIERIWMGRAAGLSAHPGQDSRL